MAQGRLGGPDRGGSRQGGHALLWLMTSLLNKLGRRRTWLYAVLAGIGTVAAAVLFSITQRVSLFTGFYWAVVTVTTVGYGDVVPKTAGGRLLAIGTMITVLPLVGATFADWAASLTSLHLRRMLGMHTLTSAHRPLVILGYTPLIPHVLPDLLTQHPSVILVAEVDTNQVPEHPGMHFIGGDPCNPHVLAKAQLDQAEQIVVVGPTDGDVLMTAIEAHHLRPKAPILAITHAAKAVAALKDIGINGIATQNLLGELIAQSVATPHAGELLQMLLTETDTELREVPVPKKWVGQPLSVARAQSPGLILGCVEQGTITLGLNQDPVLAESSMLLEVTARLAPEPGVPVA